MYLTIKEAIEFTKDKKYIECHAHDTGIYEDKDGQMWQVTFPCIVCEPEQEGEICRVIKLL